MKIAKDNTTPVSERYILTIPQAANTFYIGQVELRKMVDDNPEADWNYKHGRDRYIVRDAFTRYLTSSPSFR